MAKRIDEIAAEAEEAFGFKLPPAPPTSRPVNGQGPGDENAHDTFDIGTAATVARLAAMPPLEYDRVRAGEAERMGVRLSTLDKEVAQLRDHAVGVGGELQGRPLHIPMPDPYPKPVDGAVLLDEMERLFARHLILPDGGTKLLALWALSTHVFECFEHTPRLKIQSPRPQCGKTTVLDLLEMLVARPLATANLTTPAIFRSVEKVRPTLLIDEGDTFIGANEEMRGVLNAGHKRGGQVIRCVGEDFEPRAFAAFSPAAIAAIGPLPNTLEDRSIRLMMRRALRSERPARIDRDARAQARTLLSKAIRWAEDEAPRLTDADPELPDTITNRVADNWRPLIAVANAAGGDWPTLARELAGKGSDQEDEESRRCAHRI